MTDPIDRSGLRKDFWNRFPLDKLTAREWEALCDGCGKCCLNKLEDEETGEIIVAALPVLPTHYKCPQTGAALPVEDPTVWIYHKEEDR